MKKRFISLALILFLLVGSSSAIGHPGRTDSSGGHYVRKSGWGYPVGSYHNHNGGSSSSKSGSTSSKKSKYVAPKPTKVVIGAEKAYILSSASTKAKVVGIKSYSDALDCKGKTGNWFKVGFYDSANKYKTGYIHKNNVSYTY